MFVPIAQILRVKKLNIRSILVRMRLTLAGRRVSQRGKVVPVVWWAFPYRNATKNMVFPETGFIIQERGHPCKYGLAAERLVKPVCAARFYSLAEYSVWGGYWCLNTGDSGRDTIGLPMLNGLLGKLITVCSQSSRSSISKLWSLAVL